MAARKNQAFRGCYKTLGLRKELVREALGWNSSANAVPTHRFIRQDEIEHSEVFALDGELCTAFCSLGHDRLDGHVLHLHNRCQKPGRNTSCYMQYAA